MLHTLHNVTFMFLEWNLQRISFFKVNLSSSNQLEFQSSFVALCYDKPKDMFMNFVYNYVLTNPELEK